MSTERVEIEVSGETVNATRICYVVDIEDIVALLRELINVYENFYLSQLEIYNNPLTRDMYFDMLREMEFALDEINFLIDELEYSGYGEIIVAYYIGNRDRLLRMKIETDLTVDGDRGQITIVLDFGLSVTDRWEFDISLVTDDDDWDAGLNITWDFYERRGSHINTININMIENGRNNMSISLSSDWNETSGDFELSAQLFDGPFFGGGSVSGNLIMTNTEYTLVFDDIETWSSRFGIAISGELGAPNIDDVDFVNLDSWGDTLVDALAELFGDFFLGFLLDDLGMLPVPAAPEPALPPPPAPEPEPEPEPPVEDESLEFDLDEFDFDFDPELFMNQLIGRWEFSWGDYVWFFESYSEIEFLEDGTIINHTSNRTAEIIEVGELLSFTILTGEGFEYTFTYLVLGDFLSIIDEDVDMATFTRMR